MILDKINKPNDVKNLNDKELMDLSDEIRQFLISNVSKTGGHLASNLGTVELTIALHRVLSFPEDVLIFDVGHQCYTHKILTGRKSGFDNLRKYNGMSGFPKREESECDYYDSGHSSSSVSAALAMAHARDMAGSSEKVVCVIGDGAMTGGIAYEALNNLSGLNSNLLIVLNDNEMSISENVGGLSEQLSRMRTSKGYISLKEDVKNSLNKKKGGQQVIAKIHKTKRSLKQFVIPGMLFEDLDIMYMGPVDGHDINALVKQFNMALKYNGPIVVHVITKKGKGYEPAERHPARFHGVGPFEITTGIPASSSNPGYTDIFSTVMRKLGDRNDKIVAVTAAMADNTGLKRFKNMFPDRFFDVGIAEEHAVVFAAGLALKGWIPVVAIYSSFLQRAYDEMMIDVCMQKLHVIFAIDRAGLVGADGPTHQGAFDISFMLTMPGLVVMSPKNKWELSDMIKWAVDYDGPVAIRYPRGEASCILEDKRSEVVLGRSEMLYQGDEVVLLAIGEMVTIALTVYENLKAKGINVSLVNARFAYPLDYDLINDIASSDKYKLVVTLEDNVISGGFGEHVLMKLVAAGYKGGFYPVGIPDSFVPAGPVPMLFKELKMDADSVTEGIIERL